MTRNEVLVEALNLAMERLAQLRDETKRLAQLRDQTKFQSEDTLAFYDKLEFNFRQVWRELADE